MKSESLNRLINKAKKDRKLLIKLKNLSVEAKEYELGSEFRELEKKLFPETAETKKIKEEGKVARITLNMVGLDVGEPTAWLIYEAMRMYFKTKAKFDLKMASKIKETHKEVFG